MWVLVLVVVGLFVIYRLLDYVLRLPRISRLQDRYVFITGCDSGFGHAACKRLDKLGLHVFAGCLYESGEVSLRKSCSDRVIPLRLDITKHDSVLHAYQQVAKHLPNNTGLWGVINNAGVSDNVKPVEWCSREDFMTVLDVNVLGMCDVITTFLPLVRRARGRIVNTSSICGRIAVSHCAPYAMSKYCVQALSDSLRREMRDFGVSVHVVEPGFHKTRLNDPDRMRRNCEATFNALPAEVQEQYGQSFLDNNVKTIYGMFDQEMLGEERLTPVVDCYIHALTARLPRIRYMVGRDALYWLYPLSMLPDSLTDRILELTSPDRPRPQAALPDSLTDRILELTSPDRPRPQAALPD